MFSVTNDRGFVPQSEQFEGRDMVGEDIKAYKIIHTNDFAYNPARINVGSIGYYKGVENVIVSSLYEVFQNSYENKFYPLPQRLSADHGSPAAGSLLRYHPGNC